MGQGITADARAIADAGQWAEFPGAIDRRVERIACKPDTEAGRWLVPDLSHDFADGEQVHDHESGTAADMHGFEWFVTSWSR